MPDASTCTVEIHGRVGGADVARGIVEAVLEDGLGGEEPDAYVETYEGHEAAAAMLRVAEKGGTASFRGEVHEGKAPALESFLVANGIAFRRTTGTHHAYGPRIAVFEPDMAPHVEDHPSTDLDAPAVSTEDVRGYVERGDLDGLAALMDRLENTFPEPEGGRFAPEAVEELRRLAGPASTPTP